MAPPPTRTSLLLLLLIHVQVPILAPVRQIDATPSSLFGSNRTHLAHVISRPFRANRFFGCFPGLKPWAESYSPCGAKKTSQTALSSCHSGLTMTSTVPPGRGPLCIATQAFRAWL